MAICQKKFESDDTKSTNLAKNIIPRHGGGTGRFSTSTQVAFSPKRAPMTGMPVRPPSAFSGSTLDDTTPDPTQPVKQMTLHCTAFAKSEAIGWRA